MNAATIQRDQAIKLAPSNPTRAMQLANRIKDPWFKTQALAAVAAHADDQAWKALVQQALKTAQSDIDDYRAVGASAWPLAVVLKRGPVSQLTRETARLLERAQEISNTGSRCDALLLLYEATFPGPKTVREKVMGALLVAVNEGESWRCGYAMQSALLVLASEDRGEAVDLANRIVNEKWRGKVLRKLSDGDAYGPRVFV